MPQTRLDAPALRFQRLDLPQRLIEVFLRSIARFPRGRSIYRDRGSEKPARAGSEFVVNRHRRMNRNGFRDVSFEFYEIGMSHSSVRNIDCEVVAGIACALLRHEDELPGAIVSGTRVCHRRTRQLTVLSMIGPNRAAAFNRGSQ